MFNFYLKILRCVCVCVYLTLFDAYHELMSKNDMCLRLNVMRARESLAYDEKTEKSFSTIMFRRFRTINGWDNRH